MASLISWGQEQGLLEECITTNIREAVVEPLSGDQP